MIRRRKEYEELLREELDESKNDIAALYVEVRNKIIEPLTVRRTRTDLLEHPMYAGDLKKQKIVFSRGKQTGDPVLPAGSDAQPTLR